MNFDEIAVGVTFAVPTSELDGIGSTGGHVSALAGASSACSDGQNACAFSGDWSVDAMFQRRQRRRRGDIRQHEVEFHGQHRRRELCESDGRTVVESAGARGKQKGAVAAVPFLVLAR